MKTDLAEKLLAEMPSFGPMDDHDAFIAAMQNFLTDDDFDKLRNTLQTMSAEDQLRVAKVFRWIAKRLSQ